MQKEIQARYQGSLLGLLWSYVQPLVRFCMYFFVIGLVLGLHKTVPNFAIHMFAALVGVHFFTETFSAGHPLDRAQQGDRPQDGDAAGDVPGRLGDRLGDQLVPAAADPVHRRRRASGWTPDPMGMLRRRCSGFAIITVLGTALALLFSAMNVFFRDFQNIVVDLHDVHALDRADDLPVLEARDQQHRGAPGSTTSTSPTR